MTREDLEMKDAQPPTSTVTSPPPSSVLHSLKEIASLIDTGAYVKEVRYITRGVRGTIQIRRSLTGSSVASFLAFALGQGSEAHSRLSSYLPKEDDCEMDVDMTTSGGQLPASAKHAVPELEIYCYLLVLIFLIDQKKYDEAKTCLLLQLLA